MGKSLFNPFSLEGKNIFITGASSGIGKSIAIESSKMGGRLIISGRDEERLDKTLSMLENNIHMAYTGDIADAETITEIVSQLPQLDGIVMCAGINDKSLLKNITTGKIAKMFGINCISPLIMTKELLKQKKMKKGCSIVVISSISSTYATLSNTLYACSKSALESFVRVSALELSAKHIRVNAIRPGVVKTPILDNYTLSDDLNDFVQRIPLGRMATPEDIAYGAIYLLSDASSWMTGSCMTIDGGITLR